ncbi:MAG TPA: NUDIX domain-containing protein [Candidatus Saccharimonadales bacterium]|nr:NUDIX domain-containing protein [Candidatus Saccharimonadales bacterium]
MPHIHTEPGQHDHTVSIYIIRTDFAKPKLLFHFHKKAQLYTQFGGHIEIDETPWGSVLHELREESGYDMSQLELLQPRTRPTKIGSAIVHPTPVVHATMSYHGTAEHFHTDTAYAFTTAEAPAHLPEEGESTDIILLSRDEITPEERMDDITRDTALYVVDTILPSWQPVSPTEFS